MQFSRTTRRSPLEQDLTPLIDVVLQLIIFFLYTSSFTQMIKTRIDLPEQPGQGAIVEPATIVIDLDADGTLLVETRPITLEALARIVTHELDRAGDPALVDVLLRPDRNLPASHLNEVASTLSALGVQRWKLGTRVPVGAAP